MTARSAALLLSLVLASPSLAHTGAAVSHGFASGLLHPLLGLDHVLAMVAVGLWAGFAGGRALWAWPGAFVAAMILAAFLGTSGTALPGAELAIGVSVLVLGCAVATRRAAALGVGIAVCGLFASAHGYAHGAELPPGQSAGAFIAGFALATVALHGLGLGLGHAFRRADRLWLPEVTGGAVAASGLVLLLS